jgi:hypothetical protein
MLLNPELRPENDGQAGWHRFLRTVHDVDGLAGDAARRLLRNPRFLSRSR